jgi:flagellar biosynthetic protein FlhB
MLLGLLANYAQVGFLFTFEPIKPKWDKLDPMKGIKKILVSKRSAVELVKGLLKLAVVGIVAYTSLQGVVAESMLMTDSDVGGILGFMASSAFSVMLKTGLAFLVIAVLDYMFQRYEHQREMKMTKSEVKEESKQMEGDPLIKSRIRSIQRDMARRRMMQEVPKADVVITNPTHIAVALKYDMTTMPAPKVVAKGAEKIAEKMRTLAHEHHVPIVEDKPLAWALYKSVEVNATIPPELFQAVAQTLAYIYQLKGVKPTFSTN